MKCQLLPPFLLLIHAHTLMATENREIQDIIENLLQWVTDKGGFINPNIEVRSITSVRSYELGLFATEKIGKNDPLLVIPHACAINVTQKTFGEPMNFLLNCDTVVQLVDEIKLGEESEFEPYVKYLLSTHGSRLPAAWSEEGKQSLGKILGAAGMNDGDFNLPPDFIFDWITEDWHAECNSQAATSEAKIWALAEKAALLVIEKHWDGIMVPVYDIMNHHNGPLLNTISDFSGNDEIVKTFALRDIQVGEELYLSKNLCLECGLRKTEYGTPELLRDYGIVENYPQRWMFSYPSEAAFQIEQDVENDEFKVFWLKFPDETALSFFEEQLERLIVLELTKNSTPENEFQVISEYYNAMKIALQHAISDTDRENLCLREEDCFVSLEYDSLEEKEDFLDYQTPICDWESEMEFDNYTDIETVESAYHKINFFKDDSNEDTCFQLDDIVQICGSYRPHYHEVVVHSAARYLDEVKRVVFVGGGDSMLLHEILKYPSLELVVGLELDQNVTRYAFKHFGTQPHYDNEKVEWWYGDARKSLAMLPSHYFDSFDLVLVDLSETVMSFKVTAELNIMEALGLLLKPDGIFVKNEQYWETLQEQFKYTIQLFIDDVPVLCSQGLVFASNGIDFINHEQKDHDVEALFVKPLNQMDNLHGFLHDYRKNEEIIGHCHNNLDDNLEQTRSPGILMIVEAEKVTAMLNSLQDLEDALLKALKEVGMSVVSSNFHTSAVVLILKEGYIIARYWPEKNYCAIDIHLFARFEEQDSVKQAIVSAIGSKSVSSYRIVAGGMFGLSTWITDKKNLGPQNLDSQSCNRESVSTPDAQHNSDHTAIIIEERRGGESSDHTAMIIEETLGIIESNDINVLVLCGKQMHPCSTLNMLLTNDKAHAVLPLRSCSQIDDLELNSSDLDACLQTVTDLMRKFVTDKDKISAIVVDPDASYALAQITIKFLSSSIEHLVFADDIAAIATFSNQREEWKKHFLERIREIKRYEPLFKAEIKFESTEGSIVLGIASSGDKYFVPKLLTATQTIEKKTGLSSNILKVQGGLWKWIDDFVPTQFFLAGDYDQRAPLDQWLSQQPVGRQNIFQFEIKEGTDEISADEVKSAIKGILSVNPNDEKRIQLHDGVGDGCVFVTQYTEGDILVLWDGKHHIDVNLFVHGDESEHAKTIKNRFENMMPMMNMILHDEQPRGYGRVVNFLPDIEPQSHPHWARFNDKEE